MTPEERDLEDLRRVLDRTLEERNEAESMSRDLLEERQDLLDQLHECALAEDRVRAVHSRTEYGSCLDCCGAYGDSVEWPCPTILALEAR